MSSITENKRLTTRNILAMKNHERIAMLTAYDVMTARCLDEAGIDILLVGDSLGNVVYGFDTTLPVTMEMMVAHCGAVVRGSQHALVIADLPFMSYQASTIDALKNAGRCLAEAGVQAVKLEGASESILQTISKLVEVGIPVMGHIGLTPQSVHQMGGFFIHGKDSATAERLIHEAKALQAAGCFSIVLECVEEKLAQEITKALSIITIGIGSGAVCDGEVLVVNDILGYTSGRVPRFVRVRANMQQLVRESASSYVQDVKSKQ